MLPLIHIAAVLLVLMMLSGCSRSPTIHPLPDNRVEMTGFIDGEQFKLADDGNAYRVVGDGDRWSFYTKVYDPVEMANAYVYDDEKVFRIAPDTGKRFLTLRNFSESFEDLGEGVAGLRKLVAEDRHRWGSFTLQSPATPSVKEYVALRQQILAEQSDFLDAVVAPTMEKFRSGDSSLKCVAKKKSSRMVTSKSSLSTPLVYFKNDDDFWYEAHYFIDGARPLTLMDLECEFTALHAGIRLCIFESGQLGAELKALDKPKFQQSHDDAIEFPVGRWVRVKAHFGLSDKDGIIQIWQDDKKVIDTRGITLPFRSAIYSSLEVGISAHSFGDQPCILYVDDIQVSDSAI